MRKGIVLLAFLLLAGTDGFAAGYRPYVQPGFVREDYFSLEVGTGIRPLTVTLANFDKSTLAEQGLQVHLGNASYPVLTLTEVWRIDRNTELCLTEGAAAVFYDLRQFGRFGYDPQGKPRYDLSKSTYAGRKMSTIFSLTGQVRFLWFQSLDFTVYSSVGLGFCTLTEILPLPVVVPVALRYGRNHFYVFLENNIGPYATLVHGGLGWKF